MLKLGDLNIKDLYLGTSSILKAYLGTSLVYLKASASPLVASYRCYDKTNEDEDRAILRDLTGNGHDITLNNFAFSEMSGYDGYLYNWSQNYQSNVSEGYEASITSTKLIITNCNTVKRSPLFTFVSNDDEYRVRVKISGLTDETDLYFGKVDDLTKCRKLENGINDFVVDFIPEANWAGFGFYSFLGECNIVIEQIPEYQGALVSDGVNDYGICTNMPLFTPEQGYTVIAIRQWLDEDGSNSTCLVGKNTLLLGNDGAFMFEYKDSDGSRKRSKSFNDKAILENFQESKFTFLTSVKYNNISIIPKDDISDTNIITLFRFASNVDALYGKFALWALDIYDRDLTDEEIEEAKARMIAEYEEKTGDLSLSLVAAWSAEGKTNDDEDRAILKDLTGNGHDITLNNFAFSGMSGYGGYSIDFKTEYSKTLNTGRVTGILSSTKFVITSVMDKNNFLESGAIKSHPSYKIKVTGVSENLYIRYVTNTSANLFYDIKTEGIHTIPAIAEEQYIGFRASSVTDSCNIVVELIPEYPGALCFDGVDDYGIRENMPILTDYTIIAKRKRLSADSDYSCFMGKGETNNNGAFLFENRAKVDYYEVSFSNTNANAITEFSKNDIIFRTPKTYNGESELNKGGYKDIISPLYIGSAVSDRKLDFVFYSAYLFNRSLTEQEIKTFIRENIDSQYLLPSEIPTPDVYYDFSTGSNDDENRNTIVDLSGNGNDATAYNFAWSGMSGYGGYALLLNNFTHGNYRANNGVMTINNVVSSTNMIYREFSNPIRIVLHISGIPEGAKVVSRAKRGTHFEASTDGTYVIENTGNLASIAVTDFTGECNIQIIEEPQYQGALCFDGVDDYLSISNEIEPLKTIIIKYDKPTENQSGLQWQYLYDAKTKAYLDESSNTNRTYIGYDTKNQLMSNGLKTLIGNITIIDYSSIVMEDKVNNTKIGCRMNVAEFSDITLYKFLGFRDKLTEEQIHNVIQKYNLLEGVDYIEQA